MNSQSKQPPLLRPSRRAPLPANAVAVAVAVDLANPADADADADAGPGHIDTPVWPRHYLAGHLVPYTLAMSKFWRIALAWLLAVALPIQGYAAQTMLLCTPTHHQSSVIDDHAGPGHDHAAMAHDGALADASVEMSATAADTAKTPADNVEHAGKCSVCSSCCSAAALTTTVVTFAASLADLPEVPTVKLARDRIMVGGLDRPPRLSRT